MPIKEAPTTPHAAKVLAYIEANPGTNLTPGQARAAQPLIRAGKIRRLPGFRSTYIATGEPMPNPLDTAARLYTLQSIAIGLIWDAFFPDGSDGPQDEDFPILAALGDAAREAIPPGTPYGAALAHSIGQHSGDWREALAGA
jgi:hypothetical protein